MCSFHGLTKNVETVLYAFLASGRSRNRAAYMKDSSLQQYSMASSCNCCAIADCCHLSPEIVDICSRVYLLVQVENTNEM